MLRPIASAILCWYRLILTRGGNTKATTANRKAARTIHRRGEGPFSSPPILTDQVQRSAPAGLVEEVQDHVGIERKFFSQTLFFVLVVGLDKGPVDEQGAANDVGSGHKAPVTAVKADGASISHGKVPAWRNHEIFALDVVGKIRGPGCGDV